MEGGAVHTEMNQSYIQITTYHVSTVHVCATCVLIIRNKYKFTLLDNVYVQGASAAGLSQYGDVKHHEAKSDTERSVEIVPSLPSGMQGEASRDKRPHLPGVQGECPDQEK